jgi:hypoxanthine-DNA glycosylase
MAGSSTSFKPVGSARARVLILGSFPGEESLRGRQYYGHAHNAFWRIAAGVFDKPVPESYAAKKRMLIDNDIALWDVVYSCSRVTSSDALITDPRPNDIPGFLKKHPRITIILINGRKAEQLFEKHFGSAITIPRVYLPSTSPAHASLSYAKKLKVWNAAVRAALHRRPLRR